MTTPSIKELSGLVAIGLFMIVLANLTSFFLYQSAEQRLARDEKNRYDSYLVAQELRQSSDDLTRLARTFVATRNPLFENQYLDVISIRNGRKPRPTQYNRIYWDFMAVSNVKPRPDGRKISFLQLMQQDGFSAAEFAKLKQAEDNSDYLSKLEKRAMDLASGLEDGKTGADRQAAAPNPSLAEKMLYSPQYHQLKANVMGPIDDFYVLLDLRTSNAVAVAEHDVEFYRSLSIIFLGLLLIAAIIAAWILLRSLYLQEGKWSKPLMDAGWCVIPSIIIEKQAALGLDAIDMNIIVHLSHSWSRAADLPCPSVESLANDLGIGARTVQKHVAALQAAGLLTRIERRNAHFGSTTNQYSFDGLIKAALPYAHKKMSESLSNPAMEKPQETKRKLGYIWQSIFGWIPPPSK